MTTSAINPTCEHCGLGFAVLETYNVLNGKPYHIGRCSNVIRREIAAQEARPNEEVAPSHNAGEGNV